MSKTTVRPGAEERVDPAYERELATLRRFEIMVELIEDLNRRIEALEARDDELR